MSDAFAAFLTRSLTPWHAAEALADLLRQAGFHEVHEGEAWHLSPGRAYFTRRGGTAVAAWVTGSDAGAGWTLAAAHTDSPGWKLKTAQQQAQPSGVVKIGTEVYGSPLHAPWFDQPLAVAGRVVLRSDRGLRPVLVATEALGLFPNLAIHYNREANKALSYDLSRHMNLLAALGPDPDLASALGRRCGFDPRDWVAADLFAVDTSPPRPLGTDGLVLAPRLDNLAGCHAVAEGLIRYAARKGGSGAGTRAALFFDQEEVGSTLWTGADSSWTADLMVRVVLALGGTGPDVFRAKATSFLLSVDAAHGVHPNWEGEHDPAYAPHLGAGPVLKASARLSYATTAEGAALVKEAARSAGLPLQDYVMKSNLVPGSTVGPLLSAAAGLPGADVGIPLWAMHSPRETAHRRDQEAMGALVAAVYGR